MREIQAVHYFWPIELDALGVAEGVLSILSTSLLKTRSRQSELALSAVALASCGNPRNFLGADLCRALDTEVCNLGQSTIEFCLYFPRQLGITLLASLLHSIADISRSLTDLLQCRSLW